MIVKSCSECKIGPHECLSYYRWQDQQRKIERTDREMIIKMKHEGKSDQEIIAAIEAINHSELFDVTKGILPGCELPDYGITPRCSCTEDGDNLFCDIH